MNTTFQSIVNRLKKFWLPSIHSESNLMFSILYLKVLITQSCTWVNPFLPDIVSQKSLLWSQLHVFLVDFFSKVEQSNIAETSSGSNIQQTEATAAKKKATLLPCPSKGCMQFGSPEKNGLCDDCYHKKGNQQQGASAATGANEQQQASNHTWDLRNTHNTVENHQFGNRSYGLQGPVQVSQIQSPSYESGTSGQNSSLGNGALHGQKCCGTNCTLFGTPEMNGYCSRCFLESTIPQSYPHSIPGNVHWALYYMYI